MLLMLAMMSSVAGAAPVSLAIDAGGEAIALEEALRSEGLSFVVTSTAPALTVSIHERDAVYRIVVRDPNEVLAARTLPVADGPIAARRAAVMLTVQAFDTITAFDDPLELPPAPADVKIHLTTGVVTHFWSRPSTPQLGLSLGAGLDLRALQFGVTVIWLGELCCERRTSGIRGDARELVVLVDAAWTFVGWGPVFGRLRVGGGLDAIRADATPLPFAGPAPTQRSTAIEGVVRVGLALDVELIRDWLRFGLHGGAWMRVAPFKLDVPSGYGGEGWFTGRVVPFTELRLEARIF